MNPRNGARQFLAECFRCRGFVRCSGGFSVVEALLAAAIFSLFVTTFFGAYFYGQESSRLAGNRARAAQLAEEGLEATRNIRDAGYSNLTDGTHGLSTAGNQWSFSGSSDASGIFTRAVTISTVDSHRKTAVSTVTWQQNPQRAGSVSLTTRLSEWLRSSSTSWSGVTETGNANLSGTAAGIKVAVSGNYAFAVRNNNNTSNFVSINVSTPSSPSVAATINLAGTPSNIAISGNYAYVTSSDNAQELQIVNISNPASPTLTGSFNAAGNGNGNGVAVSGSNAYIVRASNAGNEFVVVNISNPASPTLVGAIGLLATGYEVAISGSYAYVASSSNTAELTVVNIATPSAPSIVGTLDLSTNTDAITVAISGSAALLGQGSTLYTANISTPISPSILGSLGVGGTINDIAVSSDNTTAFLATANTAAEFRAVDISSLSSPSSVATIDIAGNGRLSGVAYDSSQTVVYGVGNNSSKEFIVFSP